MLKRMQAGILLASILYGSLQLLGTTRHHKNGVARANEETIQDASTATTTTTTTATTTTTGDATNNDDATASNNILITSNKTFYLLPMPQFDRYNLSNPLSLHEMYNETRLSLFYQNAINEQSAEMWLRRSYDQPHFVEQGIRTMDYEQADVVLIPLYYQYWSKKTHEKGSAIHQHLVQHLKDNLQLDRTDLNQRPHVMLTPTVDSAPGPLVDVLQQHDVNLFSVAFERNVMWQKLPPPRLIPIPYVVRLPVESPPVVGHNRTNNFIFFYGASRDNAKGTGGCDRMGWLHKPEFWNASETDMMVRVAYKMYKRIQEDDYNRFMHQTAEYCLILCGDTPTSRSLASALVAGCIPVQIGNRWNGYCEPPCFRRYGFTVTNGLSHLPYDHAGSPVPWGLFPQVSEADLAAQGLDALRNQVLQKYHAQDKRYLQTVMRQVRQGFIYGYGDPVTSTHFGQAADYIWNSIVQHVFENNTEPEPKSDDNAPRFVVQKDDEKDDDGGKVA